ncbi:MAG: cupin domain-containing protein [Bauldia sp.]|nr:cupin domain-containing protein [Bauldia sp.]
MTAAPAGDRRAASFHADGYLPPFRLLDADACRRIASHAPIAPLGPLSPGWEKAFAASDAMFHDIATDPHLVALLRSLLGDAVILWGASIVSRVPGEIHSWHSDVESMRREGGFASVWIGLENTSRESALNMISGSHRVGRSIQELLHGEGLSRADASEERLLAWARTVVPEAGMIVPEMADGDAVVFDGRLWHGTRNRRRTGTRKALLLQYAASGVPVHTPKTFDWPVAFREEQPPVVVVSGQPHPANLVVPPPPRALPRPAPMGARFNDASPLFGKQTDWWSYHPDFDGSTANLRHVTGHVSVLAPGATPHPPHVHQEEEILLVLDGEAEIVHPRTADDGQPELHLLGPGAFAYTPAWRPHTLRNPSADRSVTYLAYKWAGRARAAHGALPSQAVRPDWTTPFHGAGFRTRKVFEGATGYLARLHAHVTELDPEAGYAAHADGHDVAIIVLAGRIAVRRRAIGPGGMVFLPAGVRHGMKNLGEGTARYLVIEFHAPETERRLPSPAARLIHAMRTRRWPGRAVAGRIYRGLGQLRPGGTNSP